MHALQSKIYSAIKTADALFSTLSLLIASIMSVIIIVAIKCIYYQYLVVLIAIFTSELTSLFTLGYLDLSQSKCACSIVINLFLIIALLKLRLSQKRWRKKGFFRLIRWECLIYSIYI